MRKTNLVLSIGATVGIVIFSFLDWITIGTGRWAMHLNLFSSWTQINDLRSSWIWFGNVPGEITGLFILVSALIVVLLISVVLQIIALAKHNGGEGSKKFAYWGYSLTLIVPPGYIAAAMYLDDGGNFVTPTIFFFLTLGAAIIGILCFKHPVSRKVYSGQSDRADTHASPVTSTGKALCGRCYNVVAPDDAFCADCGKSIE